MKPTPLIAALLGYGLLAGCSTSAGPDPVALEQAPAAPAPARPVTVYLPAPAPPAAADEPTPLDYYEWAKAATAEELRAEQARLSAAAQARKDPVIDTVHLGILMSVSAIASRDSEREAKALLESIDPRSVSADVHEYAVFADFLLSHLEQREDLRAVTSDVVTSREELEILERNNAQLQEKIEALTSIEEQLIEREQEQLQPEQALQTQQPGEQATQ